MAIEKPTPDEVRAIIDTDADDAVISAMIDDAILMYGHCLEAMEPARQKAALKWIAAHLLFSADKGGEDTVRTSRKLGDASDTYARATLGEGLRGSIFGQRAITLDPTGCLGFEGSGKRKACVVVL